LIHQSTIQVKREQESSEVATSKAGLTRGNVSNNTLSDTIELEPPSLTQNLAYLDDISLSIVYTNLEKALPPSTSTKTLTKTKTFNPDDVYKSLESDPLYVKPLNTEHPDEDLAVTQPYLSIDAKIKALAKTRNDYISKIAKASDTSSNPTQSLTSDSPVIETWSQHLDGEYLILYLAWK